MVISMERFNPSIKDGLTKEQVDLRISEGLVNYDDQPKTKTIKQIVKDNFFTYFNFLNIALGAAVFLAGLLNGQLLQGLKNCLFMGVIIINSIISIIEEVISKKIIDKLSMLSEFKVTTIRDGVWKELGLEELVLDDVIRIETGHQVVVDAILMDGSLEVNEDSLTGESDPVAKKKGDLVLSGSFVVSGSAYCKVEHIGSDNYVSTISREAKYEKKVNSVILESFEKLLKVLSLLIIPISVIMFYSQYHVTGNAFEAIFTTVAALIGMIPEGLVLLTSSVMAVSVIRLSKYKVLVQQLYCIETLARVDVICLDKTGTITEGRMNVVKTVPYDGVSEDELNSILASYATLSEDNNDTMKALKEHFKTDEPFIKVNQILFSSERKFSGIEFKDMGTIYIGASDFLLSNIPKEYSDMVEPYLEDYRVLTVVRNRQGISENPKNLKILGFIVLEDVIRPSSKDTLDYFKKQGVAVKIISGDQVKTVLNIAKKVGLDDLKGIDVGHLNETELREEVNNYQIFGRVTPSQKKLLVSILQESGHTVAMTGDGINDVLALKQSDCAISVASGSDAAKNVAQLVLLNNDFSSLPEVVSEGRRTINNVERSASLLLVKTIYTVLLILFSICVSTRYFFVPIQLTLITTFTIGTPSFILALEPNHDLVRGNFLLKIVSRSLPTALTVFFNAVLVTCFTRIFELPYDMQSSLTVLLTSVTGFIYLYKICKPFTILRGSLFFVMFGGYLYCLLFQYEFFNLMPLNNVTVLIGLVLTIDSLYIYRRLNFFITWLFHKFDPTILVER